MTTKPACFGTMFPDLSRVTFNTPHDGKAFSILVKSSGMGVTDHQSSVNMQEWDACTDCPAYDRCYDLCVAKLLLHLAAQNYGMARAL
jgi:hypothetical protein